MDAPILKPVAWADDAATEGRVGNVASTSARNHWARGNWVERNSAKDLAHPLFSQSQIELVAREIIRDYSASYDPDLDELVKQSIRAFAYRFGVRINVTDPE